MLRAKQCWGSAVPGDFEVLRGLTVLEDHAVLGPAVLGGPSWYWGFAKQEHGLLPHLPGPVGSKYGAEPQVKWIWPLTFRDLKCSTSCNLQDCPDPRT